jgi:hypothetical protein
MLQLDLDDYITQNGKPAKVSCIYGCTRIHAICFRGIDPAVTVHSLGNPPGGDQTCTFRIEVENR